MSPINWLLENILAVSHVFFSLLPLKPWISFFTLIDYWLLKYELETCLVQNKFVLWRPGKLLWLKLKYIIIIPHYICFYFIIDFVWFRFIDDGLEFTVNSRRGDGLGLCKSSSLELIDQLDDGFEQSAKYGVLSRFNGYMISYWLIIGFENN